MNTPQKGIAFEIPVEKTPKSAAKPAATPKRLESALGDRRTLSKEDLTQRLDDAAIRKQAKVEALSTKAKATVERAKGTAQKVKQETASKLQEQKVKLAQKLETAEKLKEAKESDRLKNVSEHLTSVNSRKEANNQPALTPGEQDLAHKLKEAEDRRKALEEGRLGKLSSHHQKVEMRKSQENLYARTIEIPQNDANDVRPYIHDSRAPQSNSEKIAEKLAKAELRRKELEGQQKEKFAERETRAEMVRKRKATSNAEMA